MALARQAPLPARVEYALIEPERRGEIGRIADAHVRAPLRRIARAALSPSSHCCRACSASGDAQSRGELLSFLLFDKLFIDQADRGSGGATRSTGSSGIRGFWCSDAAHDFGVKAADPARVHEEQVLSEWRELRRR